MIGFGIAHQPIKKCNEWHLIGRCVTDIRVGDRFTQFIPSHLVGKPGYENTNFVRDDPVSIDLKIIQITAYKKSIDFCGAGMTAALILTGDGESLGDFGELCGSRAPTRLG
jgi:hypothetical protein